MDNRPPVASRALACAIAAFLACCMVFVPWHETSDRGLGDVGCAFTFGGCGGLTASSSRSERAGVEIVGAWPGIVLLLLALFAVFTAMTHSRRLQVWLGATAIGVAVVLGPYAVLAAAMSRMLVEPTARGGEIGFHLLLGCTFVTGIANVRRPRTRVAAPSVELPHATARYHTSGTRVVRDPSRGDPSAG